MGTSAVSFPRRQTDWVYDRLLHSRMSIKRVGARLGVAKRAEASMFFDSFPRFYETARTRSAQGRLNLRYEAIFGQNAEIFAGARVLDIASHDGRWSLAALHTGAAEVIGIEARDNLVEAARENLDLFAPAGRRYAFRVGDVFKVLADEKFDVDVVLCLGFLYHTLRYNELLSRIRDLDPRYLIVDTAVERRRGFVVRVSAEKVERARNAVADRFSHGDQVVVGRPTRKALRLMLRCYGFQVERISDWDSLIRDNPTLGQVNDYATRRRVTARCASTD
jgi:hypothetical protein